jgi:hypothetical protein
MMFNSKLYLTLGLAAVLSSGCGGDDAGGSVNPTLPSNAVVITADNATAISESAVSTFESFSSIISADAGSQTTMSIPTAIIKGLAFNKNKRTSNIVTGVTETYPCETGSITDNYTSTDTSDTGTLSFNNCAQFGMTFTGSFSYSYSWNNTTLAYTGNGSGTITLTVESTSFTIALNIAETGNDSTGDFSLTLSYSVSGGGFGYLVTTQTALTGDDFGINGGSLIVQGASNTRLRIDFIDCTTSVYLDTGTGTFNLHHTINTCA